MKDGSSDTICAIATAGGGAIGILRISGGEAISIADKIFMPAAKGGEPLKEKGANVITFGRIIDKNGEVVDDVLVSLFCAPHSYTGEDSVEISCHGSRYILEKVLRLLIENGCRQAAVGECQSYRKENQAKRKVSRRKGLTLQAN